MESTNDIKTLIENFKDGYAIFWLHDKIVVRNCPVDLARIDQNALVECRIFNEQQEILIRRKGDNTFWHRIKEAKGEEKHAVIRGEIAVQLKKLEPTLALVDESKGQRIILKKYEYIDYNEQGVATYVDSRFVGFEIKKTDEKGNAQ